MTGLRPSVGRFWQGKAEMMIRTALWSGLVLVALASAQTTPTDPVVATVGKSNILKSEFDLQFNLFVHDALQRQGLPYSAEAAASLDVYKPKFLERMARETAITQAAEAAGFAAKDQAVDAAIEEVKGQFDSPEALDKALAEAGIPDLATYRRLVYEALTYNAYLESLEGKFQPSDAALKVLYVLSKRDFAVPTRYCSAHILLKTAKEAQQVIDRLAKGEAFAELARSLSQDPGSKDQGGDLGCEPRGTYVAPFEAALVALKPGETSKKPVQTQFGFHVIYLSKIEPAGYQSFEEVEPELSKRVQSEALQKYLDHRADQVGIKLFPENLGPSEAAPKQ
ncbi:putative peptidyl-prolyl cis-trans isomerase Cbf2 [Meiothermus granaticius NBRC 107808]|uniref:Putative peptidyl-prolyl cis-trans isomerase Cbf2 n=2 Tax=Meiothermus TaxID=65551 RepID=A0A399FC13_9DEIN|nr:putative peptidyl-prolyl cis-trans isomerase Cbf2 [Meiothermus granaticius NBRC 107808]